MLCDLSYEVEDGVVTSDVARDPKVVQAVMEAYQTSRTGPLAGSAGSSLAFMPIVDFLNADGKSALKQLLDKHLHETKEKVTHAESLRREFIRSILKSPDEGSATLLMTTVQIGFDLGPNPKDLFSITRPGNYISLLASLAHPFSRGYVHINSADPTTKPTIDPRFLSRPLDIELYGRHMQYFETIAETRPLASYIKKDGRRIPDAASVKDLDDVKEHIRKFAFSNHHPSGTCAMMSRDQGGVVNDRLMVHGTSNLRVIDASIIPIEPRGNVVSSVYAVAERGADVMKGDPR